MAPPAVMDDMYQIICSYISRTKVVCSFSRKSLKSHDKWSGRPHVSVHHAKMLGVNCCTLPSIKPIRSAAYCLDYFVLIEMLSWFSVAFNGRSGRAFKDRQTATFFIFDSLLLRKCYCRIFMHVKSETGGNK